MGPSRAIVRTSRGTVAREWGAVLNARFFKTDKLKFFGAGRYSGIAFFARIEVDTQANIRLNIPSYGTEDDDGCGIDCHDRYGAPVVLTTSWTEFSVDFAACQQEGWGAPVPFDRSRLYGLLVAVPKSTVFDIRINDIRFY